MVKDLHNIIIIISDEALDWFYKPSMMMKKKKAINRPFLIKRELCLEEKILATVKEYL